MWAASGTDSRLKALVVLGLTSMTFALAPATASAAPITLFDDSGTASFVSGNATQALDTTVKTTGLASWKITDTGVAQDFFSVGFLLNDHQAPLSALNPANGAQLWLRYLTNTPDFRVRFSVDVWDDATSSYNVVYSSGTDTQADLIGGDNTWRTAALSPSALVSTSINQDINRTYRLRVQSWPSGPGFTQVQGSTINLDNVMVLPEPTTLGILLGLSGTLLIRRRS